ncbi:MAG: hypothetical protein IKL97_01945 [Eggerthellaceae bacterium]|nr:hypothetical protein [Eggerthellaceae bacterium]
MAKAVKEKAAEVEQVQAPDVEQAQAPEEEPEMVKVVVKTRFKDKACKKKMRRVGDVLEITQERYAEIVAAGEKNGVDYVELKAE